MDGKVFVDSEIGALKRVIVHTPGREIEAMTPKTAERLLYNDIIPLNVVRREHEVFKRFLSMVCGVFEIEDLLKEILADSAVKEEFIHTVTGFLSIPIRREDLSILSAEDLCRTVICGLLERKETLTSFLDDNEFDIPPLPNLYFTRDYGMIFRNKALTGSMANSVRRLESLLIRFVFKHHRDFKNEGLIFDGAMKTNREISLEGGDFIVINKNTLVIGISERTTTEAVDLLIDRFLATEDPPLTIFALLLPRERAFIHLDMVFTVLDKDLCLVHEPVVLGKDRATVIRIGLKKNGEREITRVDNLLEGLKNEGITLQPILCGGKDPRLQQREQWISGANSFAFSPGKIILYDCNEATLKELEKGGFKISLASHFLSGRDSIDSYKRLVVGVPGVELARGGGGIRCMTMPIEREPLLIE